MSKPCVVFDIDGVLSNHNHRIHHEHNRDWPKYHEVMHMDKPYMDIVMLLRFIHEFGIPVILCTGRSEVYSEATEQWLLNHSIPYDNLMMRADGDERHSGKVKKAMLLELKELHGYHVWFAIEDKTSVVNMWRMEGITCLQMEDLTTKS